MESTITKSKIILTIPSRQNHVKLERHRSNSANSVYQAQRSPHHHPYAALILPLPNSCLQTLLAALLRVSPVFPVRLVGQLNSTDITVQLPCPTRFAESFMYLIDRILELENYSVDAWVAAWKNADFLGIDK